MTDSPPSLRVAVIGGGISGLAAAFEFGRRDPLAQITVLEAGSQLGGKLRLAEIAGRPADVGAEALLARRPEGVDLINAVGLGEDLIEPLSLAAQLRVGGENRPLPRRTLMGIPGDLDAVHAAAVLTAAAMKRLAAEPELPPMPALDDDVAVGALVRERLGDEVLERLVEPLLGGVYAGRADALSLSATIPALAARLRLGGGSLVRAAQGVTEVPPGVDPPGPVFVSLAGGLARLPAAISDRGRFEVRTGVTVRAIRRQGSRYALDCGPVPTSTELIVDEVVIAVPAAKAAALLADLVPAAAVELRAIETASMAIVSFAFDDVAPPAGSGLLVGSREQLSVKAVTISSQKWPGTPAGRTVVRASIGRAGEVRDLQRDDADLIALARRDLAVLLGVTAAPIDSLVTRWGGGLPQYAVGHIERVARIEAAIASVPGLALCGASYGGIGIPACIASAQRAVDHITAARTAAR